MLLIACPAAAQAAGLPAAVDSGLNDVSMKGVVSTLEQGPRPAVEAAASVDPWEKQNRRFFKWNEKLDARVIRPTALGYQHHTPGGVRQALRNFLDNLSEPVVFANDVLQFRLKRAGITAFRFITNTTVGVVGLFDVAAKAGAEHHSNGFGTTLGRYHVSPGPYVYLPVVGPSTVRDLVGEGVDALIDPFTWARYENRVAINSGKAVAGGLDTRARADVDLQALMDTATDPYATLRSVYLQNRQSEIDGDLGGKDRALPDFDDPQAPPAKAEDAPPTPKSGAVATADPPAPAAKDEAQVPTAAALSVRWVGTMDFSTDDLQRTTAQDEQSGAATH
jgi:phospholipid-binding lipoprotein MlaA